MEDTSSLKRFFLEPHILKHYKCITGCFYSFNSYADTYGLFDIRGCSQLMSTIRGVRVCVCGALPKLTEKSFLQNNNPCMIDSTLKLYGGIIVFLFHYFHSSTNIDEYRQRGG